MRIRNSLSRRKFLGGAVGAACVALLSGCDALSKTQWFPKILEAGEHLNRAAQGLITSRKSMAQEFTEADLSREFRSNGTDYPDGPEYRAHAEAEFANWALRVDGLVNRPSDFSLAQLRAMRSRTQITRHDCVEGWSAIGKWTGVPLSEVLAAVQPQPRARYVVFYCADTMDDGARYYESIDLDDAYHPQTILAYGLNGKPLPMEMERHCECASSGSSATRWPNTSCASSWSIPSAPLPTVRVGTGKIAATSGTRVSRANAVIGCARFELAPLVGWAATLCDWDEAKNLPYRYRRVCFYRISTP